MRRKRRAEANPRVAAESTVRPRRSAGPVLIAEAPHRPPLLSRGSHVHAAPSCRPLWLLLPASQPAPQAGGQANELGSPTRRFRHSSGGAAPRNMKPKDAANRLLTGRLQVI